MATPSSPALVTTPRQRSDPAGGRLGAEHRVHDDLHGPRPPERDHRCADHRQHGEEEEPALRADVREHPRVEGERGEESADLLARPAYHPLSRRRPGGLGRAMPRSGFRCCHAPITLLKSYGGPPMPLRASLPDRAGLRRRRAHRSAQRCPPPSGPNEETPRPSTWFRGADRPSRTAPRLIARREE